MNTNDLIIKLGENLETLTTQYSKCITTNNFNEALNVMKNIDMVVKQLRELDFETMTSKHGTYDPVTGENTKQLSIWKQNGFGQIKDHEVFTISGSTIRCEVTPFYDEEMVNKITENVLKQMKLSQNNPHRHVK